MEVIASRIAAFLGLHFCSIEGCWRFTFNPRRVNPRKRWMLEIVVHEDTDRNLILNLCPAHAREVFELDESDYANLEKVEQEIREMNAGLAGTQ